MSKRSLLETLCSWNHLNQNTSGPPLKKQRSQNSCAETTSNSNRNSKQKPKNLHYKLNSLSINNFVIPKYIDFNIIVLFGTKLIVIQWITVTKKQFKSNHKLLDSKPKKRINIKFDSIESIYVKHSKIHLKLKYPPYFSEQSCKKLRESGQKTNKFYIIENDPTNGNAMKCKYYKIKLADKTETFINKLKQNETLKAALTNGAIQSNKRDNDMVFNSKQIKQNGIEIKQQINKKKCKYLSEGEVNKILMSLGVKRNECNGVNDCLRVAISKKYIGIKYGKCKLDINGGIKQKINNLCKFMPECMEITLERLLNQPLRGDDYECGDTQGAARCIDENCDGYCCGCVQYVTGLCVGKPQLETVGNGKFHNHCKKCKKCVGDYRLYHCDKCGFHKKWMDECQYKYCGESDFDNSDSDISDSDNLDSDD